VFRPEIGLQFLQTIIRPGQEGRSKKVEAITTSSGSLNMRSFTTFNSKKHANTQSSSYALRATAKLQCQHVAGLKIFIIFAP